MRMKQASRAIITRAILLTGLITLLQACDIQESDLGNGYNIKNPLAYVKRPTDSMVLSDPRTNAVLTPGGNLFLHDLGNPGSVDVNVTAAITAAVEGVKGAGDVMSINASYDGSRIVFALHEGVLEANNVAENTWDIWELVLQPLPGEAALRRVIKRKLDAEKGNDLDPVYLPDGRIVFTSDRQVGGRNFQKVNGWVNEPSQDERRREFALNLHVMSSVGVKIKQISYNQSDDRFPTILHTGEVVFSRWEVAGNTESRFDLYQVNPDGSEMKLLYGSHSHLSTVNNQPVFDQAFYKARQMADGRLVALLMPYSTFDPNDPDLLETTAGGGEIVTIDYTSYRDINTRKTQNFLQDKGHVSATFGEANTRFALPLKGRFASPFPIWEEGGGSSRFLISFAFCKVSDPQDPSGKRLPCKNNETVPLASPEYGLFYYNSADNTKKPVILPESGMVLTDAVIMSDRTGLLETAVNAVPDVLFDKVFTGEALDMEGRNMGAIKILSVYDALSLRAIGLEPATRLLSPEVLPCMDTLTGNATVPCDDSNENIVVDIAALADPAQTTAAQRPVHYVRVVGAMPSFEKTQGFSFGARGVEMRAILGYAPVEPDGSVFVEVPANVPFALELLDREGRKFRGNIAQRDALAVNSVVPTRTYRSHDNWLQVIPGETLVCNGCHEGHTDSPPLNTGAGNDTTYALGIPYVNTVSAMLPNLGESMAETRVRLRDCSSTPEPLSCTDGKLQRDLIYRDVWTDAALASRQPDLDYAIEYNDRLPEGGTPPYIRQGLNGNAPIFNTAATPGCLITDYTSATSQGNWTSECRIVIDYQTHIQSLWDATRTRMVDDGTGTGTQIEEDIKCTNCHSMVDSMGVAQVPAGAGQLDLTSDGELHTSSNNGNWNTSYKELLFRGFELEQRALGGPVTVVVVIPLVDDPTFVVDPLDPNAPIPQVPGDPVPQLLDSDKGPDISPFFARGSYLIETMTGTELKNNRPIQPVTVDHTNMMTRAEIRVITEWIEMGVQYFNDPGVAPRN